MTAALNDWYVTPVQPVQPQQAARPVSWLSNEDRVRIVEESFGVNLIAIHEAAHGAAAVLLGATLIALSAEVGVNVVLARADDLGDQARLSVVYAAAACLYERFGINVTPDCQDDLDNVLVKQNHHQRVTGTALDTWGAARQLVHHPVFGEALMRTIPIVATGRPVPGTEIVAALADLPRLTLPGMPAPPAPAATVADLDGGYSI